MIQSNDDQPIGLAKISALEGIREHFQLNSELRASFSDSPLTLQLAFSAQEQVECINNISKVGEFGTPEGLVVFADEGNYSLFSLDIDGVNRTIGTISEPAIDPDEVPKQVLEGLSA